MGIFEPDRIQLCLAVSSLCDAIKAAGVSEIRLGNDLASFEIAARQAGKANLVGEMFARSFDTLPPHKVMWIGLYDDAGKCITTSAARLDDIGGWSLQQWIAQWFERIWKGADGGAVRIASGSGAYAGTLTGRLVWVGEGHVSTEWRAKNLLGLVQRLLLLSAYQQWEPGLIWGFMRPNMIAKGYHRKWGYSVAIPDAFIWQAPPAAENLRDLYFVAVGQEGICRLIADPLMQGTIRSLASTRK